MELNYEECRLRRLEENKKRMEELNLTALAQSLRTPNLSPMKKVKRSPRPPLDLSAVRRCERFADKPPRSYREMLTEPSRRRLSSGSRVRDVSNRVYASDEVREYALERAEKLQASLPPDFPNFVKPMHQSNVTGGFWLGLPVRFCKCHLPKHDEIMNLVDEDGDEWPTKYLPLRTGLSGGWKGFAQDHKLADGDALLFQLIKPTVFKVYIIKVNQVEDCESNPKAPTGEHL